ncbi:hypothetical protein DOM01_28525 [Salmonella enterica subsp. enterica serovar Derby]|nr:hypothetical protein DOM01_28525 [Salmonella enterica subsp. enterica serovar Derby]
MPRAFCPGPVDARCPCCGDLHATTRLGWIHRCKETSLTRNASHLHSARVARADEFYTLRGTIEKEMAFHRTSFRGKAVHCCCDDPYRSAFVEYFIDHFADLGLARLEATNHVDSGTLLFDLSEDCPWHLRVTNAPPTGVTTSTSW